MKTNVLTRSLLVLICLSVFTLSPVFSQVTHTIKLMVNTTDIKKPKLEEFCYFEGQQPPVSMDDLINFLRDVAIGDRVEWVGESTTDPANDQVHITKVKYHKGRDIFGESVLNAIPGAINVVGTVKEGAVGDVEEYWLHFKVFENGRKKNGTFKIDPKLRIKP